MTWRPNKENDRRTDVAVFERGEMVMGGTLPLCKQCERLIDFRPLWTHTVISVRFPKRRHVARINYELLDPDSNYIAAETFCERLFWYRKMAYVVNFPIPQSDITRTRSEPITPITLNPPPESPEWTPDYE